MSGKKNKRLLGVISIFLWAVILTIVLRSYLEKTGYTCLFSGLSFWPVSPPSSAGGFI